MTCQHCQQRLSAYLDGELSDHDASALRGHLRTCDACREQSAVEASVIDTLRQLPPVDPPAAMWQAIRTQLAHEEIADAGAPRHLRLWRKLWPWAPQALGGLTMAAAAVGLLWYVQGRAPDVAVEPATPATPALATAPATMPTPTPASPVVDVSQALADEATMIDRSYRDAVGELVALIGEARGSWQPAYVRSYDERVRELRARVDREADGVSRERAWQELMRYLQTTLTRPEVAMGVEP